MHSTILRVAAWFGPPLALLVFLQVAWARMSLVTRLMPVVFLVGIEMLLWGVVLPLVRILRNTDRLVEERRRREREQS